MTDTWQQSIQFEATKQFPTSKFPMRIPKAFAKWYDLDHADDPVMQQFIPSELENDNRGMIDPLEEHQQTIPGLLHKYKHRVLLTLTGACAVHCRYCFRRHFPYAQQNPLKNWHAIWQYLEQHQDIHEVIFSGGDPLMLRQTYWDRILEDLKQVAHIKTLRIHSRIPTVLPDRIDQAFIDMVEHHPQWQWVMVTHINHADEINAENRQALKRLRASSITCLNQSVLLKGINDDVSTLKQLSHTLFHEGILPYYLHQLDPVQGAMHFEVALDKAKEIHRKLQKELPGYLVPRLAQEEPRKPNKTLL